MNALCILNGLFKKNKFFVENFFNLLGFSYENPKSSLRKISAFAAYQLVWFRF